MKQLATGMFVLLAGILLSGCNNNLKDENALLMEENESLRAQIGERNNALEAAHDDLRDKDGEISQLRDELANAESPTIIENVTMGVDPFGGIEGVRGEVTAGQVTAIVESDILFDSGKSKLKPNAKRALDQVAAIISSQYNGRSIRVSGHTDTDPIRKSGYKSNYHLGFERAYAVREYLIGRGVPPTSVYVASHGPDQSLGSKQESRRVEIAVVLHE